MISSHHFFSPKSMKSTRTKCLIACGIVLLTFTTIIATLATFRHVTIRGQQRHDTKIVALPRRAKKTGELKILQLADVQIKIMDESCKDLTKSEKQFPCSGRNTTAFIRRLIEYDRPDLVIFTGDNVLGSRSDMQSQKIMLEITDSVASAGIPFAVIIGNHDVELPWMSVSALHEFMRHNRSQGGGGAILSGNGLIKIIDDQKTILHIHLFDYMHRHCIFCYNGVHARDGEAGPYHPITDSQIDWFKQSSDPNVTSIAFAHIPLQEYDDLVQAWSQSNMSKVSGFSFERVYYGTPSNLYQTLQARNVKLLSVGHDHTNDFCARENGGVYLCYAGGVGYTTYGRAGWPRRARMIIVKQQRSLTRIRTYKILDDANLTHVNDEYIEESLQDTAQAS